VPVSALTDARVPLVELWGPDALRLEERMEHAASERARLRILRAALLARLPAAPSPDPLVGAAMLRLEGRTRGRVSELSRDLGVSERQLLRRFTVAVGYGPKTFQRIARLQRLLQLARRPEASADLAGLAGLAGFADQAHLTHECVSLTGFSPAVLVRTCGPA
jgi:AraC-like DNA-binding protein